MNVVAVAGGTGKLGWTLVDAILKESSYKVIILGRKHDSQLEKEMGALIIPVDYSDPVHLTKTLEDQNVHTVISALSMGAFSDDTASPEISLIKAADMSKCTKRMISSDWGFPHTKEHISKLFSVGNILRAHEELDKVTNLETTYFLNGCFMDYWGTPTVESRLGHFPLVIDVPSRTAAIPGSGNTPVAFTHSRDVAKFVAASLSLEKWDPVTYVIGDKLAWNQVLQLAENATGHKFKVKLDSIDNLRNGKKTELPGRPTAYGYVSKATFDVIACNLGIWFEEGVFDFCPEKILNDQFPNIKTMKMEDMLRQAWSRQ